METKEREEHSAEYVTCLMGGYALVYTGEGLLEMTSLREGTLSQGTDKVQTKHRSTHYIKSFI